MAFLAPAEKAPAGKPLKVGSPHDPAEREADRIAELLTAPEEPALPVCAACAAGGAPCAACGGNGGSGVLRRQAVGGGQMNTNYFTTRKWGVKKSTAIPDAQLSPETDVDKATSFDQQAIHSAGGSSPQTKPGRYDKLTGHISHTPFQRDSALPQLQRGYGNQYVGRVIQAKLTVGQPGDVYEQEADRIADQIMRMPEDGAGAGVAVSEQIQPLQIQRMCTACEEEEEDRIHRKEAGGTAPAVTPAVESRLDATRGGGQPLPESVRAQMEPRFGADFSGVRVHTGGEAAELNRALKAQAFTRQRDIYFGTGRYQPETWPGQQLLAHELTHVVQQERGQTPHIQKFGEEGQSYTVVVPYQAGDIKLSGGETVTVVEWDEASPTAQVQLPAPYINAYEPFAIPKAFLQPTDSAAASPHTLPYQAIDLGPASLLPDIPEGIVVEIDPAQLPPSALQRAAQGSVETGSGFDMRGWPISQAGRLTGALADRHLMTQGFSAAGPYSIGMVGYPNSLNLRALRSLDIPQSPILFGHTIAYARVDGRIVTMTSFGPRSLTAAGLDAFSGSHAGVPGTIIQHLEPQPFPLSVSGTHGFPNTSAISVEWPVTPEMARGMSTELSGSSASRLAQYAAYAERCPDSRNCVGWALDKIEDQLGGEIGQQGQPPLRHQSGSNTARQGRLQGMAEAALAYQQSGGTRGTALADLPNATGSPVVGQMSGTMRVIKWGGRLLEIGGFAYSAYRIGTSSEEEMPFVIAEEALGTIGGPLGGAVGELYVAPMRELAAGRGDATLLILPIPYIAPVVRIIEPEKHDPEGGRLIRRAVIDGDPSAIYQVMRRLFGGY